MVESIEPDLIKALRCLSSENDLGMCYMEQYNQKRKDEQARMYCWNAEKRGILCPFYQTKYDVVDNKNCWLNEIANKLEENKKMIEHYKNLEAQGKLLELPCAVGDTIYILNTLPSGKVVLTETKADTFIITLFVMEKRFGKTVFLTKSEAEQAVKKRRKINR